MLESGKLYDTNDLHEALGVPVRTLRNWRHLGRGPAYHKIGSICYYRGADVNAWLAKNRVEPTAA
ncbi:MAG: helix-turn-helix domain-containing protein [Boseongicola sp.]|nr:helix-turn-helix domain-containing protein [Boseongicola sp.]